MDKGVKLRGEESDEVFNKIPRKDKRKLASELTDQFVIGPSLPPFVEGQLRCFLHLSLGEIKWTTSRPKHVKVGVRWWGQQSPPIFLYPKNYMSVDGKHKNKAKYPVRSGPKQFTAYLKDMGTLMLDIVASKEKIGQVDIQDVGCLCQSQPIQGFYSIYDTATGVSGKEIGALFVSLEFQSISGSFNMTSSTIPTTDTPGITQKPRSAKMPKAVIKRMPEQNSGEAKTKPQKEVKISSLPPERIEYSMLSPESAQEGSSDILDIGTDSRNSTAKLSSSYDNLQKGLVETRVKEPLQKGERPFESGTSAKNTTKQRKELIVSPTSPEDGSKSNDNGTEAASQRSARKTVEEEMLPEFSTSSIGERDAGRRYSGNLIKDILDQVEEGDSLEHIIDASLSSRSEETFTERALVDLVTGEDSRISDILRRMDSSESISNDFSDTEDPIYDDSLLADLFYAKKGSSDESSVVSSDESLVEVKAAEKESIEDEDIRKSTLVSKEMKSKTKKKSSGSEESAEKSNGDKSLLENKEVEKNDSMQYLGGNSDDSGKQGNKKDDALLDQLSKLIPEGMDLDAITTLARADFARVVIHSLNFQNEFLEQNPKSTFFIEYEFPVCVTDSKGKRSFCTELMRCVSNKTCEGGILFNHRSIFPVYFDTDSLVRWWDKLLVFKVFCRKAHNQTPVLIGRATTSLRPLLLAEHFILKKAVPVQSAEKPNESPSKKSAAEIANLQVTIELGSEKSDLKRKKKATQYKPDLKHDNHANNVKIIDYTAKPKTLDIRQISTETNQIARNAVRENPRNETQKVTVVDGNPLPERKLDDAIELQSLLLIPEGRGISTEYNKGLIPSCNTYLICRSLWHDQVPRSDVCWNTVDPKFGFCQEHQVLLSDDLVQKLKNNFMVIEVWNKSLMAESDKLIGIVKINLQPFYLSFKENSLRKTLLSSQYPVIALDDWITVRNLFYGSNHGELRVTLALGSQVQIKNLLKMKNQQPVMKRRDTNQGSKNITEPIRDSFNQPDLPATSLQGSQVEHVFGISIELAKDMNVDQNPESGEKDCFVQYEFPVQNQSKNAAPLKWHRTPTTLCLSNPVFGYTDKHCFTLPYSLPVQNFLLNAFNEEKKLSVPGVCFEIWQRSYYPNIRDCLMYKASIPVAKLCAMVTMHKNKEPSFQSFPLPLAAVINSENSSFHKDAVLHVNFSYHKIVIVDREPKFTETRSPCVCISVSILRACGLKACIEGLKRHRKLRDLPSTGLNTVVKVFPSFLGRSSTRTSQIIARSFTPTFSYHVDFPVSVLDENIAEDEYDEASTLAYQLESEHLSIELYHQQTKSSFLPLRGSSTQEDEDELMIGVCKIPLSGLLSRQTGIKGWFSILHGEASNKSRTGSKPRSESGEINDALGGLEIAVKFANPTDRELVINVARGIGWCPITSLEMLDESDTETGNDRQVNAGIAVEKLWLPRYVLESVTKQEDLGLKDFRVYCRYKFYDKAALSSKLIRLEKDSTGCVSVTLNHRRDFDANINAALFWYLREELFEVQFWLKAQGTEENYITQRSRDRLLGSAYVDLTSISKDHSCRGTISGLYPLFRFGADYLGNSQARISLRFRDSSKSSPSVSLDDEVSLTSDYPTEGGTANPHAYLENDKNGYDDPGAVTEDDSVDIRSKEELTGFKFRILIEEALHLPKSENLNGDGNDPTTFASYQLTPLHSPVITAIVSDSTKPKWHFEKKETFDPSKIVNQKINFKVFKKSSEEDKRPDVTKDALIGTAVVDISPLCSGFQQIYGWYNIHDFSGQCAGQIKVGVIPERPLTTSPSSRYFRKQVLAEKVYSQYPSTRLAVVPFNLDEDLQDHSTFHSREIDFVSAPQTIDSNHLDGDIVPKTGGDTSKSMLLSKLRGQMDELGSLTNSLRSKFLTEKKDVPTTRNENTSTLPSHYHRDQVMDPYTRECTQEQLTGNQAETRLEHRSFAEYDEDTLPGNPPVLSPESIGRTADLDLGFGKQLLKPKDSSHNLDSEFLREGRHRKQILQPEDSSHNLDSEFLHEGHPLTDSPENSIISSQAEREFDSFDDVLGEWNKYKENARIADFKRDKNVEISDDDSDISLRALKNDLGIEINFGNVERDKIEADFEFETFGDSGDSDRPAIPVEDSERTEQTGDMGMYREEFDDIEKHAKRRTDYESDYNNILRGLSPEPSSSEVPNISPGITDEEPDGLVYPATAASTLEDEIREVTPDKCNESIQCEEDHGQVESNIGPSKDTNNVDMHESKKEIPQAETTELDKIPNFFMPAEKLVESMRKLRLATSIPRFTEQHHDNTKTATQEHQRNSTSNVSNELEKQFNRRKNFYTSKETRPNVDKPPPLQTSEISRIASIFSSKFSK